MPRTKDERLHAKRQQQILEAAKHCFIQEGFHRTSMRQIFQESGISAGGAYNYFSSKDDIIKALVHEESADIEQLIARASQCESPLEGIAKLISDIISYTSHDDAVLAIAVYAEACRNAEIKALEQENTAQLCDFLKSKIAEGIGQELITQQYPIAECAEFLMALVEGYIGRLASNKKLSPKKSARLAKIAVLQFLGNNEIS